MEERFKNSSAVMLMISRIRNGKEEILLQKRKNTGYCDGFYDFSATGHVEKDESMKMAVLRESKEELNIDIKIEDIEFITMIHKKDNEKFYYNGYFKTTKWSGEPIINETDKNEEITWVDIDKIDDLKVINDRKEAIKNYKNKIFYSEYGWKKELIK